MVLRKVSEDEEVKPVQFATRRDAGRVLASLLTDYKGRTDVLLMAIPRGGVPVGTEISKQLSLPLHALVVEKIQIPWHEAWQPRQSIGATGPGEISIMDTDTIAKLAIPDAEVMLAAKCARNDQAHKEELYAVASPAVSVSARTVVVIDDAVQTGCTMKVAFEYLRKMGASQIVIAAPVSSQAAYRELSRLADAAICPVQVPEATAVHVYYARFRPLTDAAAYSLLEANHKRLSL